jgi:hypothetical protein
MTKLFLFLFVFMFCMSAFAININVSRQDMKLATQAMIEHQSITTPILADVDRVLNDQATSASVTTTVSTFLAQPDVPRNITITPGGTTADVPAGDIVISGTNFYGKAITESITLTANQSTIASGLKAFKTVTSVVFPIQDGAGATYDVGVGDVLGLKRCMANVGAVAWAVFDGAFEATRPTCVADVDEVEKNTCDINGTLNGSKTVEIYFVQNFRCSP